MSEIGEEDAVEIHQVMETSERMMHKHARSAHIMHAYTYICTPSRLSECLQSDDVKKVERPASNPMA